MRINLKQTKNPRVELTPQMSMYDSLGQEWRPFIMYFHTPNVRNSTVNTDELGFRITHFNGCDYSIGGDEVYSNEVSFIVGGSTAFGVGATSDRMTLPSLLSQKSGRLFLNLGGRAFGANQELILFSQVVHKYPRTNSVIIFSGLNELYLSRFRHSGGNFGCFYFAEQFKDAMNQSILSPKRKLLKFFLYPIFGEKIDYNRIRQKDLFKIINSSVGGSSSHKSNTQLFDVEYAVNQLKKNLFIWKKMSQSMPFLLRFVLQPVPQWCDKDCSEEEAVLFRFLEKEYDAHNIMSQLTKGLYLDYSGMVQKICADLGIEFCDMNKMLGDTVSAENWLFADRAHLTDQGNMVVSERLYKMEQD